MAAQSEATPADVSRLTPHPLRIVRAARGLSQTELAEASSLTRSTISRIENYVEHPLPASRARLAAALDWLVEDLWPTDDARPADNRARVTTTAGTGRHASAG